MQMNYEYPPVSILGSTGSVGEQAIDVAVKNGIRVNCLSANRNVSRVEAQARALGVRACAMADVDAAKDLRVRLGDTSVKVYGGADGICEMISAFDGDEVVVMAENTADVVYSLKTVMQAMDAKLSDLGNSTADKLVKFYEKWAAAMVSWNLNNIANAAK
jgi:1-deoxy-D-xylulose-5-phosphate reductoisomerase